MESCSTWRIFLSGVVGDGKTTAGRPVSPETKNAASRLGGGVGVLREREREREKSQIVPLTGGGVP
jgi:hypothetical protein